MLDAARVGPAAWMALTFREVPRILAGFKHLSVTAGRFELPTS